MSILIVGAGSMGSAIALGLKRSKTKITITVVEPDTQRQAKMAQYEIPVTARLPDPVTSKIIILSIPPQEFSNLLESSPHIKQHDGIIISVMAGVTLAELTAQLKTSQASRAMPNLPCAINEGMTAITFTSQTTQQNREIINTIFSTLGNSLVVNEERLIDSATALIGGGGPAYISYFAAALIEYGITEGFDKESAALITHQILRGTSALLELEPNSPMRLCEEVMTPGGTTQQAISFFNKKQVRNTIIDGLKHSSARSRELGWRL